MLALYALIVVCICVTCTATEIIVKKEFFESCGFYTLLYTLSVAFLLYLFCYVLRVKKFDGKRGETDDGFEVDDFIRRVTKATGWDVRELPSVDDANSPDETKVKGRRFSVCRPIPGGSSAHRKSGKYGDYHEIRVKMMTSVNEKSHGSLFLRVGALAFGLGTLIYTGLEFLTFFEVPKTCIR